MLIKLLKNNILFIINFKERSINWLVWRSPKSSEGVRITSLLTYSFIKNIKI
jgi:hypothetical protein